MSNVGHGSSRLDFVGPFLMILPTVSSETSVKAVIFGAAEQDEHPFHCHWGQKYVNCLDDLIKKKGG